VSLRVSLAALACAAGLSTQAEAAQIFRQTFTGGLTAQEKVSGDFKAMNGAMGHTDGGYGNFEYSYYQLSLDLTDVLDAQLTFDYDMFSEAFYDGFNVVASKSGAFDPQKGLLTPVTAGFYRTMTNNLSNLGRLALTGQQKGAVLFDLTQFAGATVDLRFQFQSDYAAFSRGIVLDNVTVTGTPAPTAGVPEPASWALMILGFGAAGSVLRRRRMLVV